MQIDAAGNATSVFGSKHYSDGYWWSAQLDLRTEEKGPPQSDIGLYLFFDLPPGVTCASSGLVGAAAVGPVMNFTLVVAAVQFGGKPTWDAGVYRAVVATARPLRKTTGPGSALGWTWFPFKKKMPDGSPIHRSSFRSPGSPILHDGKLLVKCKVEFLPL